MLGMYEEEVNEVPEEVNEDVPEEVIEELEDVEMDEAGDFSGAFCKISCALIFSNLIFCFNIIFIEELEKRSEDVPEPWIRKVRRSKTWSFEARNEHR
jgi:hypothetical protein